MYYIVKNTDLRAKAGYNGEPTHYFTLEHNRYSEDQGTITTKILSITKAERVTNDLNRIVAGRDQAINRGTSLYYVTKSKVINEDGDIESSFNTVSYEDWQGNDLGIEDSSSSQTKAENIATKLNTVVRKIREDKQRRFRLKKENALLPSIL